MFGMIQRREHPRLALEAREPIRVARERARQDLDRDVAPELRVARPVHLAHAARAEQRLQVIAAERRAGHGRAEQVGDHCAGMSSAGSARKPSSDSDSSSSDSTSRRSASSSATGRRRETPRDRPAAWRAPRDTAPRSASSVQASCERSPRISRFSQAFASRQSPITVAGDTFKTDGGLLHAQPAEEPHLDDAALPLVELRQRLQRIVERDEVRGRLVGDDERLVEGHLRRVAAALLIVPRARVVDEDAAHHASGHREEMRAVVPRDRLPIDQADDRPR